MYITRLDKTRRRSCDIYSSSPSHELRGIRTNFWIYENWRLLDCWQLNICVSGLTLITWKSTICVFFQRNSMFYSDVLALGIAEVGSLYRKTRSLISSNRKRVPRWRQTVNGWCLTSPLSCSFWILILHIHAEINSTNFNHPRATDPHPKTVC